MALATGNKGVDTPLESILKQYKECHALYDVPLESLVSDEKSEAEMGSSIYDDFNIRQLLQHTLRTAGIIDTLDGDAPEKFRQALGNVSNETSKKVERAANTICSFARQALEARVGVMVETEHKQMDMVRNFIFYIFAVGTEKDVYDKSFTSGVMKEFDETPVSWDDPSNKRDRDSMSRSKLTQPMAYAVSVYTFQNKFFEQLNKLFYLYNLADALRENPLDEPGRQSELLSGSGDILRLGASGEHTDQKMQKFKTHMFFYFQLFSSYALSMRDVTQRKLEALMVHPTYPHGTKRINLYRGYKAKSFGDRLLWQMNFSDVRGQFSTLDQWMRLGADDRRLNANYDKIPTRKTSVEEIRKLLIQGGEDNKHDEKHLLPNADRDPQILLDQGVISFTSDWHAVQQFSDSGVITVSLPKSIEDALRTGIMTSSEYSAFSSGEEEYLFLSMVPLIVTHIRRGVKHSVRKDSKIVDTSDTLDIWTEFSPENYMVNPYNGLYSIFSRAQLYQQRQPSPSGLRDVQRVNELDSKARHALILQNIRDRADVLKIGDTPLSEREAFARGLGVSGGSHFETISKAHDGALVDAVKDLDLWSKPLSELQALPFVAECAERQALILQNIMDRAEVLEKEGTQREKEAFVNELCALVSSEKSMLQDDETVVDAIKALDLEPVSLSELQDLQPVQYSAARQAHILEKIMDRADLLKNGDTPTAIEEREAFAIELGVLEGVDATKISNTYDQEFVDAIKALKLESKPLFELQKLEFAAKQTIIDGIMHQAEVLNEAGITPGASQREAFARHLGVTDEEQISNANSQDVVGFVKTLELESRSLSELQTLQFVRDRRDIKISMIPTPATCEILDKEALEALSLESNAEAVLEMLRSDAEAVLEMFSLESNRRHFTALSNVVLKNFNGNGLQDEYEKVSLAEGKKFQAKMAVKYGSDVYLLMWDRDYAIGALYGAEAVTRMFKDKSGQKRVTKMVHSALQEQLQMEEAETALDKALQAITLATQEQLDQVVNLTDGSVQIGKTTKINKGKLKDYFRRLKRDKPPAEIAEIARKLRNILISKEQQEKEEAESALDKTLLAITLDTNQKQLDQVVEDLADDVPSLVPVTAGNTAPIDELKKYFMGLKGEEEPAKIAEIAEKLRDILIPKEQQKEKAETALDKALLAVTLDTTQEQLNRVVEDLADDIPSLGPVMAGDTAQIDGLKKHFTGLKGSEAPAKIAKIAEKLRSICPPALKWETVPED